MIGLNSLIVILGNLIEFWKDLRSLMIWKSYFVQRTRLFSLCFGGDDDPLQLVNVK